jgi:hypothetical protein
LGKTLRPIKLRRDKYTSCFVNIAKLRTNFDGGYSFGKGARRIKLRWDNYLSRLVDIPKLGINLYYSSLFDKALSINELR